MFVFCPLCDNKIKENEVKIFNKINKIYKDSFVNHWKITTKNKNVNMLSHL